jgi:chromosome segregation ATPase
MVTGRMTSPTAEAREAEVSRSSAQLMAVKNEKLRAQKTLQSKERENNFLRREVERVTAERNSLDAALQSEKAYIRRLEHKMTAGGPDTAQRCASLRSKLKTARDELQVETTKTVGLQKELEEALRDKASVLHALELRAQDLSAEGGADVPSRLLYAVAKGREEAVSLAVQIAEKNDEVRAERELTEHLREKCDELEKARKQEFDDATRARAGRADADARAERARTAAEKAVASAHAEAARAGALAEEAASRCVQLGTELAKERERCDALHRALDDRDAFHSKDLDVLRREMELAIEATEREARDEVRVAQTELENVSTQLSVAQGELTAARQNAAATASGAKESVERTNARALEAEAEAHRLREHASQLEEEGGNLTAQIEAFAVVNARLQEAASSAQARADAQSAKTSSLQAQIMQLESSSRVGRESRVAGETELKARLKKALEELASVIAERDETRLALRETLAKCASAMAKSERAETAERAARAAVASLEKGKRLLQETMAGQLEAVKAQLTRQREQNGALEAAVRRRDADADRLRKMVAKEGIGGGHEAKSQGGT